MTRSRSSLSPASQIHTFHISTSARVAPLLILAVAWLAAPLRAGLLPGVCDPDTTMTLIGLDTGSGQALFQLTDSRDDRPPALLEVPSEGNLAFLHHPPLQVFGGSIGPGPVLGFVRCGEGCLEVFQWREGRWQDLGEPLEIPSAVTVRGTYDRSGSPWVVALGTEGESERGWAFGWDGLVWRRHGPLEVRAVGEPAAVPDPRRADAIRVGSARFAPDQPARSWLAGLPALPPDALAEVLPFGTERAVVLGAEGEAFLSPDQGVTWKRAAWAAPDAGGRELVFDRPTGDRTGAPAALWVDAKAERPRLILAELAERPGEGGGAEGWNVVARVPSTVKTDTGATLGYEHILRLPGDRWWLLTPCLDTAETSGLVSLGPENLETPRFVSIVER